MVTFPFLRKCTVIPVISFAAGTLLLVIGILGLCGCQKVETPVETTPTPTPPAASAAPSPATPNSFVDVTAQLDPGGELYLYLSTAQWLGNLSHALDTFHDALMNHTADESPQDRQTAAQSFALLKDIVQKSGFQDITGIGASSFNYAPGLYRNKLFIHHYPADGSGVIWSLHGTAPHALTGLDLLPADTALAGMGDFDLARFVNFLRQEINQAGSPSLQQAVTQWQTQFAGLSGLQVDDVLGSLAGSFGMVLTLDATENMSIPIGGHNQNIPAPRLALLFAVKNDLIFKQVDKLTAGTPGVGKVDEPGVQMRSLDLASMGVARIIPTIAQWNGYFILSTNYQLIRDIIATQNGTPGFKSTPEYATLSAGLPQQGNRFAIVTRRFSDTLVNLETQAAAANPGGSAQAALMRHFQNTGHLMSVGATLPNGWLTISQGSQGSSQFLPPLLIAPALAAEAALPALNAHFGYGIPASPSTSSSSATLPSPATSPGTSP